MILARAVAMEGDVAAAFARYEAARIPRTTLLHARSVEQGRLTQARDPDRYDHAASPAADPSILGYDPVAAPDLSFPRSPVEAEAQLQSPVLLAPPFSRCPFHRPGPRQAGGLLAPSVSRGPRPAERRQAKELLRRGHTVPAPPPPPGQPAAWSHPASGHHTPSACLAAPPGGILTQPGDRHEFHHAALRKDRRHRDRHLRYPREPERHHRSATRRHRGGADRLRGPTRAIAR